MVGLHVVFCGTNPSNFKLVIKGYFTADEVTRETVNESYFLCGLSDQQLVVVSMKNPKNN